MRVRYRYLSMSLLALFLLGLAGYAAGEREWVGMGLAFAALALLGGLVPRARRKERSDG